MAVGLQQTDTQADSGLDILPALKDEDSKSNG